MSCMEMTMRDIVDLKRGNNQKRDQQQKKRTLIENGRRRKDEEINKLKGRHARDNKQESKDVR